MEEGFSFLSGLQLSVVKEGKEVPNTGFTCRNICYHVINKFYEFLFTETPESLMSKGGGGKNEKR